MARNKPSARSRSVPAPSADDGWDLKAAYYRPAQHAADEAWHKVRDDLISPYLQSLHQVRRARRIHRGLTQLGTAFSLFAWGGLTLLTVKTAFATQLGGTAEAFLPKAMLGLIALTFLGLQRAVSAWFSSRDRELQNQELMYLSCLNALAQSEGDAFERVIEGLLKQLRA